MLILNTVGETFLWEDYEVKRLGYWKVRHWTETPLHYADDSHIFWGGPGGVWCYNAISRTMRQILFTEKCVEICGCSSGRLRMLFLQDPPIDEQRIDIVEMDYDGRIRHSASTKVNIKTRLIYKAAWNCDNIIALSTVAAPQKESSAISRFGPYRFTNLGRAIVTEGLEDTEYNLPKPMLYLVDRNGNIRIAVEDNEQGNLYCGNNTLAKCCSYSKDIHFMRIEDLRMVGAIDSKMLSVKKTINPPSFVCFLSKEKVLVGTWNALFVYVLQ